MDELSRITRLLKNRVHDSFSSIDLSGNDDNPGKEQQLLNGVLKGEFNTDDEASFGLYGTDGTDQRFRMLKSRLRHRLLNVLFLVEYKDSKTKISNQYENEALNYILKAKILRREGLGDIAEKMVNKALAISMEAEFTSVTLDGLEMLRSFYALSCRPAHFKRNNKDLEKYRKLYQIEEQAMDIYYQHRMLVSKSVNSRKKSLVGATKAADELEKLWEQTGSYNIFNKYYFLKLMCHESIGEYDTILKLTEHVENQVRKNKINPLRFDPRHSAFMKTYALLRTKQYDEGIKYARVAETYFEKSSNNLVAHLENYFLLAVRKKDYELSKEILLKVFDSPYFVNLKKEVVQRWKLLRAYLYYVHPSENLQEIVNFDQFYVSLSILKEDKNGFNVALMILEFMHYLSRNEKDKLLDKVERLEKYLYRHLNEGDVTYRDKLFFKLMLAIIDTGFDVDAAKKRGNKLYEKLKIADEPGDAYAELEIIPYEHLWEHLMKVMSKELALA